jgi:hypothetical protein
MAMLFMHFRHFDCSLKRNYLFCVLLHYLPILAEATAKELKVTEFCAWDEEVVLHSPLHLQNYE